MTIHEHPQDTQAETRTANSTTSNSHARIDKLRTRAAPLDMTSGQSRSLGHDLVDRIADFLASIRAHPVTRAESPEEVRAAVSAKRALPEEGQDPESLLQDTAALLFEHSLFNGHPRFYGYITSSAAPIGMLADMLAAAVNANVGAWKLATAATEIEVQVWPRVAAHTFLARPTEARRNTKPRHNASAAGIVPRRRDEGRWQLVSAGTVQCLGAAKRRLHLMRRADGRLLRSRWFLPVRGPTQAQSFSTF